MQTNERIIIAADVATRDEAMQLMEQIGEKAIWYKIGMQLFTSEGPQIVKEFKNAGKKLFLDLKFHDIPNTVFGAVSSAAAIGVDMLTIHTCGGTEMMKKAAEARDKAGTGLKILGVTLLTSIDEATAKNELRLSIPAQGYVLQMADMAASCGIDGVVASAQESAPIKQQNGSKLWVVTPGIRPVWASKDDQARIKTPAQAILDGSDQLVIGRPITGAQDKKQAFQMIIDEIEEAAAC